MTEDKIDLEQDAATFADELSDEALDRGTGDADAGYSSACRYCCSRN